MATISTSFDSPPLWSDSPAGKRQIKSYIAVGVLCELMNIVSFPAGKCTDPTYDDSRYMTDSTLSKNLSKVYWVGLDFWTSSQFCEFVETETGFNPSRFINEFSPNCLVFNCPVGRTPEDRKAISAATTILASIACNRTS